MSVFSKINSVSHLSGSIRTFPKDFQVDEIPVFEPSGQGEHVFLHIKKTGENTDWVAGQLAKIAGVTRRDVSYAGMKDRNAVTTQWFSVWMPGREGPDWQDLSDSVEIIEESRHDRKLKRGTLKGNHFKLTIRNFVGDEEELKASVNRIVEQGVPNYFGEQRFGRTSADQDVGYNVLSAEQWFKGEFKVKNRQKRSIYLSAARSWIFNHLLSERVKEGTWNQAVQGDVFMLEGTKSIFTEAVNDEIISRVIKQEIHPTGVLWGKGNLLSQDGIAELESSIANRFETLCNGLEKHDLKQERRALRLRVSDMRYTVEQQDVVCLNFSLPLGTYATTVLAEIGDFQNG
ncbi:MAG TPA: tRNA pseudouridine(13) synthase TruD [Leucothrix mucor]|nr:tRNA pseudouridine(13) synthase TruD [Leucothrix mucor]